MQSGYNQILFKKILEGINCQSECNIFRFTQKYCRNCEQRKYIELKFLQHMLLSLYEHMLNNILNTLGLMCSTFGLSLFFVIVNLIHYGKKTRVF